MAPPAYGPCDYNNASFNGGSHILTEGVYCGGIRAQGGAILTFEPGIYVLEDGDLSLNGGASIEGDEVAFYLTGAGSIVDLSGGDSVDLSAPTDGPLAGFVFYADSSTGAASSKVTGNGYTYLEGSMYFPTQRLTFSGNASSEFAASPYTMVIARKIKFAGGAQFNFSIDYASSDVPLPSALSGQTAQLVQ